MARTVRPDRLAPLAGMGDQEQGQEGNLEATMRRAREEMRSVTRRL